MVKVKSVDAYLITADTYTELVKAVGNELKNKDGFNPKAEFLDHKSAIIYHAEVETPQYPWSDRRCCECGNYDWGKGCPYRDERVTLMMPACSRFTIEYEGGDE